MIVIAILPIVLLSIFLFAYLRWNFDHWQRRRVKGPLPRLWYGCFKKSFTGVCNLVEELDQIYKFFKTSESYVGVFMARSPKLFILDPLLAKQILTKKFGSVRDNESSKWSNHNIDRMRISSPFVSTGDTWKEKRSELVPVLTTGRIRSYHKPLKESANKLVHYIERHLGESMDAKELINRYTADFMASFIWGIKTHTDAFDENSFTDVHKMANKMIEQAKQCVSYYVQTENFPWLRKMFSVRFFPKDSDDFFKQLADYALKMRIETTKADTSVGDQTDVINHLLQLRNKKSLNMEQIAGHTTTIMIDGFETGAIVTAHLLLMLARNPRAQQKLRDELNLLDVEKCSYDSINNLEYLDQCLNETLRLFPPLSTLFKLCTETFQIENKNGSSLEVETGMGIFISSYSFHRDPDFYPAPETFWPERFSSDIGGVRKFQDMGVFLPFGDGPRICPGMKLGQAEAKMAVAFIVKNFKVNLGPGIRWDNKIAAQSFLLGIDGGIHIQFETLK